MRALVGYTGFVGSNIYTSGQFDAVYNSQNIADAYGTEPDLLIYAGMRAEKYLANHAPQKDMDLIYQAQENIRRIAPKRLVLISTIDVFGNPVGIDETACVSESGLQAYGLNRYRLERWVRENYPTAVIIRLPGLFGKNIKKNFIYDYINVIPFMLKEDKFKELCAKDQEIAKYYEQLENGFYQCIDLVSDERELLRNKFKEVGFTALNFTDSRNVYQFYPLNRLWDDIQKCLANDILLFHPATEPVSAAEIYEYLAGGTFGNVICDAPVFYDYRTQYAQLFGGNNGYIMNKQEVLQQIRVFVESEMNS